MTCRDIERLILEKRAGELGPDEGRAVKVHLDTCPECRKFEASVLGIRAGLEALDWEPLPEALDRRTKRMALDVLRGEGPERRNSLPSRVLAALAALTVLTVVWVTASLAGLGPEQTLRDLPLTAKVALLFIAQNAFILFFTPIILRATRPGPNGHHGISS
jgi:anti-sigma factor RsiW